MKLTKTIFASCAVLLSALPVNAATTTQTTSTTTTVTAPASGTAQADAMQLLSTIHLMDIAQKNSDAAVMKIMQDKAKNFPPAVQQKLQPLIKEELQKSISANQAEFQTDVTALIASHFTQNEVQDMNKFFATPTGQKMVTIWPVMQPEIEKLGRKWSKKVEADVMTNVTVRLATGK